MDFKGLPNQLFSNYLITIFQNKRIGTIPVHNARFTLCTPPPSNTETKRYSLNASETHMM